jgi:hypothetical protein
MKMIQTIKTRRPCKKNREKADSWTGKTWQRKKTNLVERQDKSRRGTGQNPTERQGRPDREKGHTWQRDNETLEGGTT